ncbi:IS110 family transposase [Paracoccus benzoatiresistens]|uniref:IS110 family transposase n=1 Tax=Paracoccus benzoatiresistens TaxID=2997341 RepID=A0ABT4J8L1_9RHOB|nr:IS110 family transposase [Paracoccus sp. EF6]MCZ0963422.1 IS110 family transposase [Paracoccus sp. EF6]
MARETPSDPHAVARTIRKHAAQPQKVIFESGPLATWFFHALTEEGLPAICIEARHAQKIPRETLNKTDANDADSLAQLAEAGFYKAVRVKSFGAMRIRTLIEARAQPLDMTTQLTNQIRRFMKIFGVIIPKGTGRVFDFHDRKLVADDSLLAQIILPLLEVWLELRKRAACLGQHLLATARQSSATKRLMTIPGIGAITAIPYVAAVEHSDNFWNSRAAGSCLGPTSRRYRSGEADYDGHISRRGDRRLRGLLYEEAAGA